jgi:hypothetical protein
MASSPLLSDILKKLLSDACIGSHYEIKAMGWQRRLRQSNCPQFLLDRYSDLTNGVYVDVQNFKGRLPHSKHAVPDSWVRYTFRVMHFRNASDLMIECAEWRARMGNLDDAKIIFREPLSTGRKKFLDLMRLAIKTRDACLGRSENISDR